MAVRRDLGRDKGDRESENLGVLELDLTDLEDLVEAISGDKEVSVHFSGGTVDEPADLKSLHPGERGLVFLMAHEGSVVLSTTSTLAVGTDRFRRIVREWARLRKSRKLLPGMRKIILFASAYCTLGLAATSWAIAARQSYGIYISLTAVAFSVAISVLLNARHGGYAVIHYTDRADRLARSKKALVLELVKIGVSVVGPIAAVLLAYALGAKR